MGDKKACKGRYFFTVVFLVFVILAFGSIILRTATRQIIVKHMGITNNFTQLILFDVNGLNEADETNALSTTELNWRELYPFSCEEGQQIELLNEEPTRLDKLEESIESIKGKITTYVTDFFPFYRRITEMSSGYEKLLLWNFSPASEYNNITKLTGGYLVGVQNKVDVTEAAESTINFADFCEQQEIEFLYIQIPTKVCQYEDTDISGITDFSNQNADEFLAILNSAGVKTYDHRTDIHEEGLNHHSLFFNTDHHWTGQAGLWASQHILQFLNETYGYNLDVNILDNDNYEEVIYEDWFLGSQGKKVTLSAADPDDISIIYPKFNTRIHYEIPNLGIDEYGSFDITYDMSCINEIDYYNKNPYGAYNHADQPLIRIENELINDGPRVLVVHKSYTNCVLPFLAMGIKYVDSIDLRHFDGSLQSFIQQEKPDLVIVTYESIAGSIDYSTYEDVFDFR